MDISNIVSNTLKRLNEEHSKKRVFGHYYPSESWSCLRKKWYSFRGFTPEKLMPLGVFEMGRRAESAFEWMMINHYTKEKVGNNIKTKIELDGYTISGETDVVIYETEKQKKIRILFEIKSQASMIAQKSKASEHHVKQLTCYMKALKLDSGTIVYINRNDLEDIIDFDVKYNEDCWQEVVTHFDMFHDYLKTKTLPSATPMMPKWECRYCQYNARCIEDGEAELIKEA